jgi:hypothetical protein
LPTTKLLTIIFLTTKLSARYFVDMLDGRHDHFYSFVPLHGGAVQQRRLHHRGRRQRHLLQLHRVLQPERDPVGVLRFRVRGLLPL